jgi:ubiquinone/menaquinone biosynthesis C-methylase UbiE
MSTTHHLSPVARTAFRVAQNLRRAWFEAQYVATQRLSPAIELPGDLRDAMPTARELSADRAELIERDLANIEAGYYRLPHDMIENPVTALRQSLAYFADLPAVIRRRRGSDESNGVPRDAEAYPPYYRHAFHHQTDGYLTERSARLYDQQVEVLFGGAADAMRRQALVPIHEHLRDRRIAACRLIDIGCGTGRFLTFVKDNYPRLAVTALDISPHYLSEARRNTRAWARIEFIAGAIEAVDLPQAGFDIATCIYVLHELPANLHAMIARRLASIVKPGGLLVLIDSLQLGDRPSYDALLESFPAAFHEPYYADYLRQDLAKLFETAGFAVNRVKLAYLSRVMTMRRR